MNRVTCPHCGFLNFAISAYCGRCERPLHAGETPAPARARPPAARPPTPLAPTPTPSAAPSPPPSSRMAPPVAAPPAANSSPPAMAARVPEAPRVQPAPRPAPPPIASPMVAATPRPPARAPMPMPETATPTSPDPVAVRPPPAVPPPALPAPAAVAPMPLPIELPRPPAAVAVLDDEPTPADAAPPPRIVEVVTQPARGWRLWGGRAVDLLVVGLIGALTAFVASLIEGGEWEARGVWLADYVAEWTYAHPVAVTIGLVASVLAAFGYGIACNLASGRTVGRYLFGTELVTEAGEHPSALALVVRSTVGALSFVLFGAGHFWSVVDGQRRSWADRLSRTVVVLRHDISGERGN